MYFHVFFECGSAKPPSSSALLHSARFICMVLVAVMVDDGISESACRHD